MIVYALLPLRSEVRLLPYHRGPRHVFAATPHFLCANPAFEPQANFRRRRRGRIGL